MKKIYFLVLIIFFTVTSLCYADVDFRNTNLNDNFVDTQDNITLQEKSLDNNYSKNFYFYETKEKNSEFALKLSLGLYNDIQSKGNTTWYSDVSHYEKDSYGYWRYISSDHSNGHRTVSYNNNDLIYDIAAEYRYYIYNFIGIGGGINIPLKKIEIFPGVSKYTINPYLSLKIKNFLKDVEMLNNFYILFNLGTLIPLSNFIGLDLGFDIGVGYEYKKFVFELSYSKYSIRQYDNFYNYEYYSTYPDSSHRTDCFYHEYGTYDNVDIKRFKLTVGYKF